jgi:hypothetical protein
MHGSSPHRPMADSGTGIGGKQEPAMGNPAAGSASATVTVRPVDKRLTPRTPCAGRLARVSHSGPPLAGPSLGVPLGSPCRRIDVVTCVFTPTPPPVDLDGPDQHGGNRDQEEEQVDHRGPRRNAFRARRPRRACAPVNSEQLFNEAQAAMEPGWLQRLACLLLPPLSSARSTEQDAPDLVSRCGRPGRQCL